MKIEEEIERKFLVRILPDLSGKENETYERYYLYRGQGVDIRIQKVNERFEFERKSSTSKLGSKIQKFEITKNEFVALKKRAGEVILRDSYLISKNPEITIKIYHGKFEGFIRAEVEFEDKMEAKSFKPLSWMGKEITNSPLGHDSTLLNLSKSGFKRLIKS